MRQRILLVEDDVSVGRALRDNLVLEQYEVEWVTDGATALARSRIFSPDLALLDVMIPGVDGFELCDLLRRERELAIILLTARNQKSDKLRGLSLGADDYVTKPFDLEELLARIHAVLRRSRPVELERIVLGPVVVDFCESKAWNDGQELELTHREFELLRYLAMRPLTVVYRDELLRHVWGYASNALYTRAVDHAIARLRRKIEFDTQHPRFIHTVRGDGYYLLVTSSTTSTAKPE